MVTRQPFCYNKYNPNLPLLQFANWRDLHVVEPVDIFSFQPISDRPTLNLFISWSKWNNTCIDRLAKSLKRRRESCIGYIGTTQFKTIQLLFPKRFATIILRSDSVSGVHFCRTATSATIFSHSVYFMPTSGKVVLF